MRQTYDDLMSMVTQSLVPLEQDEVNGQADYDTCELFDELFSQVGPSYKGVDQQT